MHETGHDTNGDCTTGAVGHLLTDRLLRDAGLNDAEARVYRTLLDLPDSDAAALAWRLDSPPPAVERHLRGLARRGFTLSGGEPACYRAVDPALALHRSARHREHALLRELVGVGRVTAALPDVARAMTSDRRRRHQLTPPVTVLDPTDVPRISTDLAATASTSLRRIITRIDTGEPASSGAVERRTLYRRALLDDDTTFDRARRDVLRGADVRLLPDPAIDLIAIDDHTAMLSGADLALILHPSPLLDLALRYFDHAFDRAIPLGEPGDTEATWRIADDDRELLRLLSAGLKDQAIARHLGIGLRTVVRRIGNLARNLDAETRFQLGVQARTRGLT